MKTAIATILSTVLVFIALSYTAHGQDIPASSNLTVEAVWSVPCLERVCSQPNLQFARARQSDGYKIYIVCETQREDCKPLEVGKTYPVAVITNDKRMYPYHKRIEQVVSDKTCTSWYFRTLVVVSDPMGDKIRQQQMAFGHTEENLFYAQTARPDDMAEPCRVNK
jgi:hypothetical protein